MGNIVKISKCSTELVYRLISNIFDMYPYIHFENIYQFDIYQYLFHALKGVQSYRRLHS